MISWGWDFGDFNDRRIRFGKANSTELKFAIALNLHYLCGETDKFLYHDR